MATVHTSQFTLLDYANQKSRVEFYNGAITAGSLAGFLTQFGNLRTAIEGISRGVVNQEAWVGDRTLLDSEPPTDNLAHRENKWLVLYKGNTSEKIFRVEIPAAHLYADSLLPQSDFADLTQTQMAAFKTAFETLARTPDSDTETVTMLSAQYVGRNL